MCSCEATDNSSILPVACGRRPDHHVRHAQRRGHWRSRAGGSCAPMFGRVWFAHAHLFVSLAAYRSSCHSTSSSISPPVSRSRSRPRRKWLERNNTQLCMYAVLSFFSTVVDRNLILNDTTSSLPACSRTRNHQGLGFPCHFKEAAMSFGFGGAN
jgi:hypothetical protein